MGGGQGRVEAGKAVWRQARQRRGRLDRGETGVTVWRLMDAITFDLKACKKGQLLHSTKVGEVLGGNKLHRTFLDHELSRSQSRTPLRVLHRQSVPRWSPVPLASAALAACLGGSPPAAWRLFGLEALGSLDSPDSALACAPSAADRCPALPGSERAAPQGQGSVFWKRCASGETNMLLSKYFFHM